MAKRHVLFILIAGALLAILPGRADAQTRYPSRFLQSEFLPVGARNLGMGGGHAALPGGLASAYYNPALLPWIDRLEFVVEGGYVVGPTVEVPEKEHKLVYQDRGNFSLVGLRFPDAGGFSFALLEATRYDHDIQGYLFGKPPEGGGPGKPPKNGAVQVEEDNIIDYQDKVTINSFGLATGYKAAEHTSFGLAFWIDRKKVFKSIDYGTSCTDISDDQINNGWIDSEASTNDVGIHFEAGLYHRVSDKVDMGLAFNSGTDLTSVLQVREWQTCSFSIRKPTVEDKTPVTLTLGGAYYQSRRLRFALDAEYQNWGSIAYHKNVIQLRTGVEWDRSERLILRGGFYTALDPSDVPEEFRDEAMRDIERSGSLVKSDEYFLSLGAGWWLTPYLLLDGAIANSDILSSEPGRTTGLLAVRFLIEPGGSR